MRSLKKLVSILLIACAIVIMLPASLEAAEPQLRFSDPSTTQGATFNVDATFYADDIGSVSATLTYDASALKFISGDNATDNGGRIQLTGSGNGSTQLTWTLQFQALQVTTTEIEIASVSATSSAGSSLEVTRGSSSITIGEGDSSLIQDDGVDSGTATDAQVDINGTSYTVVDFSDILLPTGFTKSEVALEGGQCPAALQESSGKYAVCLANSDGDESFFLYDPDDSSFSPFEQIAISQDRFIIPLTKDVGSQMPNNLQETTFTVNGKEFPAWQNTDSESFYVLYALNSDGEEVFYQYDSVDNTYQRYTIDNTNDEQGQASSGLRHLFDILRDNIDRFLVGTWLVFLLFLIIIIILAIKLHHRNLELDDLYDEYGIDLEEEPEEVPDKKKKDKKADKKSKKQDKLALDEDSELDDDFEDYEDDDFEDGFDSGYEDEYDLDGDDDNDDSYDEEDYEDDDYDEDYEEDYDAFVRGAKRSYDDAPRRSRRSGDEEDIDDLDELLNARVREPAKRPKKESQRRSHAEADDTFKMDIIDLD